MCTSSTQTCSSSSTLPHIWSTTPSSSMVTLRPHGRVHVHAPQATDQHVRGTHRLQRHRGVYHSSFNDSKGCSHHQRPIHLHHQHQLRRPCHGCVLAFCGGGPCSRCWPRRCAVRVGCNNSSCKHVFVCSNKCSQVVQRTAQQVYHHAFPYSFVGCSVVGLHCHYAWGTSEISEDG